MTAQILLGVIALACLVAFVWREQRHEAFVRLLQEDWALERRELANRIQHPNMMPLPQREGPHNPPEPSKDEQFLAKLGQLVPGGQADVWLEGMNGDN